MHKPMSAAMSSTRSKIPTSCISSSLYLRPQNSVKLPAISMKTVQKNPDQLTIEDLPTIRSQVMNETCILVCVCVCVCACMCVCVYNYVR